MKDGMVTAGLCSGTWDWSEGTPLFCTPIGKKMLERLGEGEREQGKGERGLWRDQTWKGGRRSQELSSWWAGWPMELY